MDKAQILVDNMVLGWKDRRDNLKRLVKVNDFDATKEYFFEMHQDVHFGEVYGGEPTICDYIWKGLTNEVFSSMPIKKYMTIAWCFLHLYRIEDIVSNILIAEQDQVFNKEWLGEINSCITDTGNALSYKQTLEISQRMNMRKLKEYCIEVGKNTISVIKNLKSIDLQRKPSEGSLARILKEGCLTKQKNSLWLRDFWGGKTIGGLLTIPLTDHHMMHLPGCLEIIKT